MEHTIVSTIMSSAEDHNILSWATWVQEGSFMWDTAVGSGWWALGKGNRQTLLLWTSWRILTRLTTVYSCTSYTTTTSQVRSVLGYRLPAGLQMGHRCAKSTYLPVESPRDQFLVPACFFSTSTTYRNRQTRSLDYLRTIPWAVLT